MTSVRAASTRLSAWLTAAPFRNHDFVVQLRNQTCFIPQVCFSSSIQSRVSVHTLQKSLQLMQRQCQLCHRRMWSNLTGSVPQLDLETENDKTQLSSDEAANATEILQNLSPEEARKLKIIKLEFDVMEQMNGQVPEKMTDANWLSSLQMDSKSKRSRYYAYLRKIELKQKSRQKKKEVKQQQRAEVAEETEEARAGPKNTIFMMVYDSIMKKAGNYRLAHAMQFGQPLIFDMDYEQYMRHQDCRNLVDQLLITYGKNRDSPDPFHFVFTSLDPNGRVFPMLRQAHLTGQHFMGTMTDRSYLDLFPRERLVYLSPHANNTLKAVDANDIYIVGGFIDKACQKPVSLARAKEQGIRTAKFPLDTYLLWGMGSKSLTLDQVIGILLDQRRTKDWREAFKVIPRRKLVREDS